MTKLTGPKTALETQLLLTLTLVNLFFAGAIFALALKFGWMALLAIAAVL